MILNSEPVPLPFGGGSHFLWEFLTVSGSILTLDFGFEDGVFQLKKPPLNIIEAKRSLTIVDKSVADRSEGHFNEYQNC